MDGWMTVTVWWLIWWLLLQGAFDGLGGTGALRRGGGGGNVALVLGEEADALLFATRANDEDLLAHIDHCVVVGEKVQAEEKPDRVVVNDDERVVVDPLAQGNWGGRDAAHNPSGTHTHSDSCVPGVDQVEETGIFCQTERENRRLGARVYQRIHSPPVDQRLDVQNPLLALLLLLERGLDAPSLLCGQLLLQGSACHSVVWGPSDVLWPIPPADLADVVLLAVQ